MSAARLGSLLGWTRGAALCLAGVCLAALCLIGACANREHMRDDFGVKTRAYLQKQHVHTVAATESPTGLDSEEAALIQQTYRKDMGSGDATSEESDQVLVIEQPKSGKSK